MSGQRVDLVHQDGDAVQRNWPRTPGMHLSVGLFCSVMGLFLGPFWLFCIPQIFERFVPLAPILPLFVMCSSDLRALFQSPFFYLWHRPIVFFCIPQIFERFVSLAPKVSTWMKYAKFESKHGSTAKARAVYERAISELGTHSQKSSAYTWSSETWDSGLHFRISISGLRISIQSTYVPIRKPVCKCGNLKSVWKFSLLVHKLTEFKFVIRKS
jgi:hypothetical protein